MKKGQSDKHLEILKLMYVRIAALLLYH